MSVILDHLFEELKKSPRFSRNETEMAETLFKALEVACKTGEEQQFKVERYNPTGVDIIDVIIKKRDK